MLTVIISMLVIGLIAKVIVLLWNKAYQECRLDIPPEMGSAPPVDNLCIRML